MITACLQTRLVYLPLISIGVWYHYRLFADWVGLFTVHPLQIVFMLIRCFLISFIPVYKT